MCSSRALKRARSGDVLGDKAAGNRLQSTSGTAASTSSPLIAHFAGNLITRRPLRHEGAELHARAGTLVAFTRCWGWSKGFPDDPSPKERASSALLARIPEAVAELGEAQNQAAGQRPQPGAKAQPSQPADETRANPTSSDIVEQVENSINNNSLARIMDAVRA